MSIHDTLKVIEAQGLGGWGETEFLVRRLFQAQSQSTLLSSMAERGCQHIVEAIYADRGVPLPRWALLETFDQLRARRPFDERQVIEARQLLVQLRFLYRVDARMGNAASDKRANLRRCILLANLVDQAQQDGADSHDGADTVFSGPFSLPPGPFNALWKDIDAILERPPSIITCMAIIDTLGTHDGLYPGRQRIMEQLLWPMVLQWVIHAPCPLPFPWARHQAIGNTRGDLQRLKERAESAYQSMQNSIRWYKDSLHASGHVRTGSLLPRALQCVLQQPLITAPKLAKQMSCVSRTAEGSMKRLLETGVLTCVQRSGQLKVVALSKDPLEI